MRIRATSAVCAALMCGLLLASSAAIARGLQVSPIKLHFEPQTRVQELRLSNDGDKPLVFEIKAMRWTQANNRDHLERTRDLLVTPPLTQIEPGQRRSIRVGIRQRVASSCETSYRIEIMEVPQQRPGASAPVNFRTRMLLPAFVRNSASCKSKLKVSSNGQDLLLVNRGDSYLQLHEATLSDGLSQWPVTLPSVGYILSDTVFRWRLPEQPAGAHLQLLYKDIFGEHSQNLSSAP